MRAAALYDVHGNLPALEAVLHDLSDAKVDCIVVGGDVVAGPMPSETLALLQSVGIATHFIRGNAESELLRYLAGKEPGGLSARANEEARWLAQTLMPEHKNFVSLWSTTLELEIGGLGRVLFCHATPNSDIEVFTRLTPEEKLAPIFENLTVSLVVCGHTHMQFDRRIGGMRVVNAGSVGMPFGKTGADWLLLDTDIEFRHANYDLTEAAERIRQSNYPQAEDFAANNLLQTPSEAQALDMLSLLEVRQAQNR
ncbi:MAG: metallophosphatase family protein [Chloroflexales bacterium]|nr:metallophosphatase family protein [Chloroflexales bacterium]